MNIKINNKNYVVPQLGFGHMVHMEDMGFFVQELFEDKKIFSLATAFVGVVVDCGRKEAEELCQQHILGGGNIAEIYEGFAKAIESSGFFKKLLGIEDRKSPGKKKAEAETEADQ